ncbi:hypothetical protein ACIO3O_38970 [Streptomyces sp. NPDC087440]|uniref:ATP dependent DNA ligase n=1 Tax=Streptomyces sp. NPDC087440 TaxID=3365790 RepID=UPI0037F49DA6
MGGTGILSSEIRHGGRTSRALSVGSPVPIPCWDERLMAGEQADRPAAEARREARAPRPFTAAPAVSGARWVLPRRVADACYATCTRSGLLRHPSFHRLRPNLAPESL